MIQQADVESIVIDYLLSGNDPAPAKTLTTQCFVNQENAAVFSGLKNLISKNIPIDPVSAASELKDKPISQYLNSYLPSMNILYYVSILQEHGAKKNLAATLRAAIDQLNTGTVDFHKIQSNIINALNSVHQTINPADIFDSGRMVEAYEEHINNLRRNMVHTGIHEVDTEIRGIAGGEVLTIIARAGSYKTAFLQNILRRHIKTSGTGAVFFSLEMPVASLTERYIQIIKGWPGNDVYMAFHDWSKENATENTRNLIKDDLKNLFIVTKRISLQEIPSYVNYIKTTRNIDISLIGIDYLGLLNEQGKSEYEIVSKIAKDTKDIAKQLNIPVIVLSQVSRKGGEGETEITMDSGRGSGAIEEAADFLFGLWQEKDDEGNMDALILKILKNRKGRAGTYWSLTVNTDNFRFEEHAVKRDHKPSLRVVKKEEYE